MNGYQPIREQYFLVRSVPTLNHGAEERIVPNKAVAKKTVKFQELDCLNVKDKALKGLSCVDLKQ